MSFSSNKIQNLTKILKAIDNSDAYLDIFPEYAMGVPSSGLNIKYVRECAEPLDGKFITSIMKKTSEKNSAAIFTSYLREKGKIYNVAVLAERGEIKALYRKIHLFNAFGHKESDLFSPGKSLAMAEIGGFKVGLAVCFDLRFPEIFRAMMYKGVNLFVVPSGWYKGKHKVQQWKILTRSRAHENTSYLIAVDQTDPFFIGHSIVTSPLGYALREAQNVETSFVLELSKTEIRKARELVPIISLSKPELYGKL